MKDGLHPHAPGLEILSRCVAPLVAQFTGAAIVAADPVLPFMAAPSPALPTLNLVGVPAGAAPAMQRRLPAVRRRGLPRPLPLSHLLRHQAGRTAFLRVRPKRGGAPAGVLWRMLVLPHQRRHWRPGGGGVRGCLSDCMSGPNEARCVAVTFG